MDQTDFATIGMTTRRLTEFSVFPIEPRSSMVIRRRHTVAATDNREKRVSFHNELCIRRFSPLGSNADYKIQLSPRAGLLFSSDCLSLATQTLIKMDACEMRLKCPSHWLLDDVDFTVFNEPWFFDCNSDDCVIKTDGINLTDNERSNDGQINSHSMNENNQFQRNSSVLELRKLTDDEMFLNIELDVHKMDEDLANECLCLLLSLENEENERSPVYYNRQLIDMHAKSKRLLTSMLKCRIFDCKIRKQRASRYNDMMEILSDNKSLKRCIETSKGGKHNMSQVTKNNLIYLKDKNDNWSSKWRMFASKKLNEMLLKCRVCKQSSSNSRHSFLIVTIPRLFCFNVTLDTENGKISQLILTPNFSELSPFFKTIITYLYEESQIKYYVNHSNTRHDLTYVCMKATQIISKLNFAIDRYNELAKQRIVQSISPDIFGMEVRGKNVMLLAHIRFTSKHHLFRLEFAKIYRMNNCIHERISSFGRLHQLSSCEFHTRIIDEADQMMISICINKSIDKTLNVSKEELTSNISELIDRFNCFDFVELYGCLESIL